MKILKKIKENLIVIIFFIFIFGMSVDYSLSIVSKFINSDAAIEETEYKEEFFEVREKLTLNDKDTAKTKKDASMIHRLLESYKTNTTALSNHNELVLKDFFLNLNARLCRYAGMSYIPGTAFLKNEDGSLITVNDNQNFNKEELELNVGFLRNFVQSLDEKGINYVYVNCPNKEQLMGEQVPIGFVNHSENEENKYMIKLLNENDIPLLDLSKEMIKKDEDAMKMFYKTDHHWKTEYGIHAAKHISEYLNSKYNYTINTKILELSNYDIERYEKCLLGSTGINSTASFVETEDFNVFIPKEENEFSFKIPSKKVDIEGGFDIFINREKLDNREVWPINAYASYIYANSAYLNIENKTIEDDHKILVIKDSFANVIVPYLAQTVKRVDVVDLRKGQTDHFNGDIMSLIEENNYDTILFIFNDFSYEYDRLFLK